MKHGRHSRWIAVVSLILSPTAIAGAAAWIDFNGDIPGESTDVHHQNWIDVNSFTLQGTLHDAGGFSIGKSIDSASPALFGACINGTIFPTVNLDLNRAGSTDKEIRLARLELEEVIVTSQETSGAVGGEAAESVGLSFRKIIYTYITTDSQLLTTEFDLGTVNPDSDNDGMPDAWESANGLTVGSNDSNGDLDGDGLSNINEYQLGTNPRSGTSFFKATLIPDAITAGDYQLTWNSVAGKSYVIEWSPDLVTRFATVRTVTAEGPNTTATVTQAGNIGFYRVRLAP